MLDALDVFVPSSESEVAARLAESFDSTREAIENELRPVWASLIEAGLARVLPVKRL